jgi:hypothetical protein
MNIIVPFCLLCFLQPAEDKLILQLDADFEECMKTEKQLVQLRKAAQLLEETNSSDRWTNYMAAAKLLREVRSKTGIPLLLKYMVKHSAFSTGDRHVEEYLDTVAILTGVELPNPCRYIADRSTSVREGVQKIVDEWWTPNKEKLTTDIGKMSREQRAVLVDRLLKKAERVVDRSTSQRITAQDYSNIIYSHTLSQSPFEQAVWFSSELHPALEVPLLAAAGYEESPSDDTRKVRSRIPFVAVLLLADMRKNGDAPDLDKIAEDNRQNAATRLTCVLALRVSGEQLKTPVLLSILDTEKALEARLTAILMLRESNDRIKAGAKLVELLDDPNSEICTAAICAIAGLRPPQALPKLKKVVDEVNPRQSMVHVFEALEAYKTKEACDIIVSFIDAGLEDSEKDQYLIRALWAFEIATGKRWNKPGGQEFYRDTARQASQWWKEEGKIKSDLP